MYGKRKYGQSSSYSRKRSAPATPFAAKVRRLTAPSATWKRKQSAQRAAANARVGGYLGIENKFYDTFIGSTIIASTTDASGGQIDPTTVNCLSAPAQGSSESQRDGKNIRILSVHVTGKIDTAPQTGQTNLDQGSTVYVALVLDKQTNGAQANSSLVFSNPSGQLYLAGCPLRNLEYSKRFKVLASWQMNTPQIMATYDGTNIVQGGSNSTFRFDKKLNLPVTFNDATAGIANVVDNSLHMIAYCSNTAAQPLITYNARIRFVG